MFHLLIHSQEAGSYPRFTEMEPREGEELAHGRTAAWLGQSKDLGVNNVVAEPEPLPARLHYFPLI